jgi:hypothetical protein
MRRNEWLDKSEHNYLEACMTKMIPFMQPMGGAKLSQAALVPRCFSITVGHTLSPMYWEQLNEHFAKKGFAWTMHISFERKFGLSKQQ